MNYPYWIVVALLMLGLYTMIGHRNLTKKVIGMSIFQTAIILFFLVLSIKRGASLPIVPYGPVDARQFVNPLPHALMLTAIVVMVATSGVALAILIRLHRLYGTLEEDVLLERLAQGAPPPEPPG